MSDDDNKDAELDERPAPGGDRTMQIDAFAEIVEAAEGEAFADGAVEAEVLDEGAEEAGVLEGGAPSPAEERPGTAPPPLPPRRPGRTMIIVGIVVVLVAAGLGIAFGELLTGTDTQPRAGQPAEGGGAAAQVEAAEEGPAPTPIRLDTVVIGTEEGAFDPEAAPEVPQAPAEE